MDGSKNKKLVSNLQVLLRKKLYLKINMKMVNSQNDLLIQLVDLIAGSIRRGYYERKGDYLQYRNIIQCKIAKETNVKKLDLVSILEPV